MDDFIRAYIECALWSSHDNADDSGGEPLDKNYDASSLTRAARKAMERDCKAFYIAHRELIEASAVKRSDDTSNASHAGHDFWLTRNGHGAGFWDGDWPESAGEILTEASKAFGSQDLYVHRKRLHVA